MIQRAMQKKRAGEGGFTLVELLIVIVILGILAAIVVLAIGGLSDTAESATCKSGAKAIESAQDAYYAKTDPNNTYGTGADLWAGGGAAKLLKTNPDPVYVVTGNATSYSIAAAAGQKCAGMTTITGP
jgi:prepilin-type N-terminal cleavage/methylation domain-containing protein